MGKRNEHTASHGVRGSQTLIIVTIVKINLERKRMLNKAKEIISTQRDGGEAYG